KARTLTPQRGIRSHHKGRPAVLTSLAPGQWSVPGLAAELGMPTATIYNWIYRGWITARHAPRTRNWIIAADGEQMRQLRERRAAPRASTLAPAGHRQNKNPTASKERNHEKAAQLDRCQRWPTSIFHWDPATLTSRASGTGPGAWAR